MDRLPSARSVGLILLAAGGSRRMGKPKQLLPFAGTTLLRYVCKTAMATPAHPIVVVLGADSEACAAEIVDLPVQCVHNSQWTAGMGGSFRAGLTFLTGAAPEIAGTMVLLVDQPLVGPAELMALLAAWNPPQKPIAAALYNGGLGVPAIFARAFFDKLADLRGQMGAKALIAQHATEVTSVEMPAAVHDIDTLDDYQRVIRRAQEKSSPSVV